MDVIDLPSTSDITSETVDKMNKAYEAVFSEIIDLSTPDFVPGSTPYLQ